MLSHLFAELGSAPKEKTDFLRSSLRTKPLSEDLRKWLLTEDTSVRNILSPTLYKIL